MTDEPQAPDDGVVSPFETPPTTESLEAEVLSLRKALEVAEDRALRLAADFDNAKKRLVRDRDEHVRFANEALIRDLLPVLDNFDRALAAARAEPAAAAVTAGVELILRELLRVLDRFGATQFSAVGQRFDPTRHEAVARIPTGEHPEMTVIDETARGYLLHGRVLRPAMVAVAVAPGDAS